MADLIPHLNDGQRLILETLYRVFRETGQWPRYQYVASVLDDQELDLQQVLESMPPGLYWPAKPGTLVWHDDDEILGLRVRGLACCRDAETDLACLLACIRLLVETWRATRPESPQSVVAPTLRFSDLVEPIQSVLGGNPELYRVLLALELMKVEPFLPSWEGSLEDPLERHMRLSRDVLRFRQVETINDLLEVIPDQIRLAPEAEAEPDEPRDRLRPRLLAWVVLALAVIGAAIWFVVRPGPTSGGTAIIVIGFALTAAIVLVPNWRESTALVGLATLSFAALAAGITLLVTNQDSGSKSESTVSEPSATPTARLRPPARVAVGLPNSGPTLEIWNKVTSGPKLMREDEAHPVYLSTVPRNYCKDRNCAIPGTNMVTGVTIGPAVCQRQGARATNGDDTSPADDRNPGLYSSRTWYGIRRADDTLGYLSDVWVRPAERGGLGLPPCGSA